MCNYKDTFNLQLVKHTTKYRKMIKFIALHSSSGSMSGSKSQCVGGQRKVPVFSCVLPSNMCEMQCVMFTKDTCILTVHKLYLGFCMHVFIYMKAHALSVALFRHNANSIPVRVVGHMGAWQPARAAPLQLGYVCSTTHLAWHLIRMWFCLHMS